MANYNNPNTQLTASRYAWDVTFRYGTLTTQRIEGSYDRQPGATVGSLLTGLTNWYAQSNGIPAANVAIESYSLREK